tara:strand:- start:191 stop:445 length:255 start_codon:yes stop_codon:yes gene_type:complete
VINVLLATEQTGALEKALSKTIPSLANFSIAGMETPCSLYNFIWWGALSSVVNQTMLGTDCSVGLHAAFINKNPIKSDIRMGYS